jgi:hypothetical protein
MDGVVTVTMNPAKRLKALTAAMLIDIADMMDAAALDLRVQVVSFDSNGRAATYPAASGPRRGSAAKRAARLARKA